MKTIKIFKDDADKKISLVVDEETEIKYIEKILLFYDKELIYKLRSINSPYFPRIYVVQERKEGLYILEEFIEGESLNKKQLTTKEVKEAIHQVCLALNILHQQKPPIIHRDIKPEHILYKNGKIRLIDFDIAKQVNPNHRKDTQILGSIGYAAPEQFGFQQSDARTDIFALGKTMCYLLTGGLELIPGMSYYSIVKRAVEMDPKNRFQSVKEMDQVLCNRWIIFPGLNDVHRIDKYISWFWILIFLWIVSTNSPADNTSFKYYPMFLIAMFLMLYLILFVFYNKKQREYSFGKACVIYFALVFGEVVFFTFLESML